MLSELQTCNGLFENAGAGIVRNKMLDANWLVQDQIDMLHSKNFANNRKVNTPPPAPSSSSACLTVFLDEQAISARPREKFNAASLPKGAACCHRRSSSPLVAPGLNALQASLTAPVCG